MEGADLLDATTPWESGGNLRFEIEFDQRLTKVVYPRILEKLIVLAA